MRLHLGLGLFTLTFAALAEPSLAAASVPLPPPELHCAGPLGECAIDNTPQDFLSCECTDGTSDGFVGGSTWASYSSEELLAQCEQELESLCSVPPPPPPVLECISRLGECTITASPVDHLECACNEGAAFVIDGGNEWAGLSDEALLMVCEQELATGCAIGGETSDTGDSDGGNDTGDSDGGNDTGDSDGSAGSTGGTSDTSEPGDTGNDGDGGASEGSTTGDPDPTTTGSDPMSGTTEGSEGESSDGEGSDGDGGASNGGRGCSIAPRSASNGLALALLGLLALGRRRRRAG